MPDVTTPGQPTQVVPAGGPVPPAQPSPKKDVDPKSIQAEMPLACYFNENGQWLPCKVLTFMGNTTSSVALVATADGRVVAVQLSDLRHGADKPKSLPALQSVLPGGLRRHTVRSHQGKWMVASPDGIVKGEHDTEEDANAHLLRLEPAKKPDEPAPTPAKAG